jgi:hypothetical protein
MADREDDDWASYKIGFKRPPPWERFQKGQSGNPQGRPKGTGKKNAAGKALPALTPTEQHLHKLVEETVTVTLGGKKVQITKREALLLNQVNHAMKGNPLVMRDVAKAIADLDAKSLAIASAEAEAEQQAAKEKAEHYEAMYRYYTGLRERQVAAWTRAAADGLEEPAEPWPHPDDILIDHVSRTGRVRGPLDSEGLKDWDYLRRSRDHHLARVVYHTSLVEPIHRLISKMWLIGLVECDLDLPKRWQISKNIGPASDRLMVMRFEKLEALVEEGATVFEAGSQRLSGAAYKEANRKWTPLIKMLGFRSLRHMERYGDYAP